MNSKFLAICTLAIAIIALVVSIAAFNRTDRRADIREAIGSFTAEIKTTVNGLRELRVENVAQMKTKLELMQAKAYMLTAKMYIVLDNNYDKAAQELQKAADNLDEARVGASKATTEKITRLKSGITEAQKYVGDKSAQAIDKLAKLLKGTEEAVDSLGEESSK